MKKKPLTELRKNCNFHILLMGDPGTGKTTVVELINEFFFGYGLTSKSTLESTTGSSLQAGFKGQTGHLVRAIAVKAYGGVLFIDEAHSIAQDVNDEFGKQALSTLLAEMENNRDKLIVVFAGYKAQLQALMQVDPGLSSRFPTDNHIEMSLLTLEEMGEIAFRRSKAAGCDFEEGLQEKLVETWKQKYSTFEMKQQNGRLPRNELESAMSRMAKRKDHNNRLIAADFLISESEKEKKKRAREEVDRKSHTFFE